MMIFGLLIMVLVWWPLKYSALTVWWMFAIPTKMIIAAVRIYRARERN